LLGVSGMQDNKYLIGDIKSFKVTDNAIYVQTNEDNPVLIKFDRKGKHPIQIGRLGNGPGEYLWCTYFAVDEKNDKIFIHGKLTSILIFNTNGRYLKEFELPILNNHRGFAHMEVIKDDYLCIAQNEFGANAEYNWIITDSIGNVVSFKRNSTRAYKTRIGSRSGIFSFKGVLSCWIDYNDTIFTIYPDFTYRASYILTQGSHRMPKKELQIDNPIQLMDKLNEFYIPNLFLETNQFLVNRYNYKNRLGYAFINKLSGKSHIIYLEGKKHISGGITNNIDGGVAFRPENYFTSDGNEYLASIVQPFELKDHLASESFKNSTLKYPEKKKEFEKLAITLDESDNPILMLVRLKE